MSEYNDGGPVDIYLITGTRALLPLLRNEMTWSWGLIRREPWSSLSCLVILRIPLSLRKIVSYKAAAVILGGAYSDNNSLQNS